MYEDTMPWALDNVYQSNCLSAAIELDEQLDFHPDDPDKGDSLTRRIAGVGEELVRKGIRPGIVGRLIYDPSLWRSLDQRQTLLALVAAQDVIDETVRFVIELEIDFNNYFSKWKPSDRAFVAAGKLLKLGISVETEGAGDHWKQYRPRLLELKALAIFGALMDPSCWPSEMNFEDEIENKRTFKSYYFSNSFFHLLDAHYQRDVRNEWYFFRSHECVQKFHYILSFISNTNIWKSEKERLGSLKPLRDYVYPDGIEELQKKFGLS